MNKKKLAVLMLVIVMVISLALTALVGCDKNGKDKGKGNGQKEELSMSLAEILEDSLENTANGQKVNNLKASAKLEVSTKYGDTTNGLIISFAANVVLDPDKSEQSSLSLSIVDSKTKSNVLHAYYVDQKTGGDVWVVLGSGEKQQKLRINGLSVMKTLKDASKKVSDDQANEISENVVDTIETTVLGALDMVATSFGELTQDDNKNVVLSLNIAEVLKNLAGGEDEEAVALAEEDDEEDGDDEGGSILSIIDAYTGPLGLNVNGNNLLDILPDLSLDVTFKFDGAKWNDFSNATIAGVEAKINVKQKNMEIKRTETAGGGTFLQINIAKDVQLGLGLDFKFGSKADSAKPFDTDWNSYAQMDVINFTAEGELKLDKAIGVEHINLGDIIKDATIAIPVGTYSLKLSVDIDPRVLIGTSFNVNTTYEMLDLVGDIAGKAIKLLRIEIKDKANADNAIDVSIANGSVSLTNLSLIGDLGKALTSMFGSSLPISGGNSSLIGVVKSFMDDKPLKNEPADDKPGSGNSGNEANSGAGSGANSGNNETASGSGETESGNIADNPVIIAIGELIKNMTILVNSGNGNAIDIKVVNHVIAENFKTVIDPDTEEPVIDETTGEEKKENLGDTTIDATAVINKTDGMKIVVDLKHMIIDGNDCKDLHAEVIAKDGIITIKAEAEYLVLAGGTMPFPVKLELKFTKFTIGNAGK